MSSVDILIRTLSSGVGICVGCLSGTYWWSWSADVRLIQLAPAKAEQRKWEKDPPVGTPIALPARDAFGKPLPTGRVALVYLGVCSSCSIDRLQPSKLRALGADSLVLLYDADPSERHMKEFADLPAGSYLLLDPKAALSSRLNPIFTPRSYLLQDGRLLGIEKRRGEQAFFEVRR